MQRKKKELKKKKLRTADNPIDHDFHKYMHHRSVGPTIIAQEVYQEGMKKMDQKKRKSLATIAEIDKKKKKIK